MDRSYHQMASVFPLLWPFGWLDFEDYVLSALFFLTCIFICASIPCRQAIHLHRPSSFPPFFFCFLKSGFTWKLSKLGRPIVYFYSTIKDILISVYVFHLKRSNKFPISKIWNGSSLHVVSQRALCTLFSAECLAEGIFLALIKRPLMTYQSSVESWIREQEQT